MSPRAEVAAGSAPFFELVLTLRHFVTQRPFVAVGALAAITLGGGWLAMQGAPAVSEPAATESAATRGSEARKLTVRAVQLGQLQSPASEKRFAGIVVPKRSSSLSARAIGRVDEVLFDIGDSVAEGDLLVQLDDEQLQAELAVAKSSLSAAKDLLGELEAGPRQQDIDQAEARVREADANRKLAERRRNRTRNLKESRAVSQQELDESEFQFDAAEATHQAAVEQLDLLQEGTRAERKAAQRNQVMSLEAQVQQIQVRIRDQKVFAPYSGAVQQRLVDEGDVVSPGQALLEVVETGALEIHVGIPSEDLVVLSAKGTQPNANAAAYDDTKVRLIKREASGDEISIAANLDRISPTVDPTTRTRRVVFQVTNQGEGLVELGDSIEVSIPVAADLQASNSTWVPSRALVAGPRGLWVLYAAVPNDKDDSEQSGFVVAQRPVELLSVRGDLSEVRGAVDSEDRIVIEGVHRIVPGQVVDVLDHSPID
ncbi:MAG: efflux RND transporter periplasmic adaptor subunit [Planctomycetota bacterium]